MGFGQFRLAGILCVLCTVGLRPNVRGNPENTDPPIIGRKEPFCGAVGSGKFQVTMRAAPVQLLAGEPILLTIRIQTLGSWQRAPSRPDLLRKSEYAKFRNRFHIENARERLSPDQGTWEFDYQLRPRNEKVTAIPSLMVVYFKPGLLPSEKGYMTTVASGIPLQVSPRPKVQASEVQGSTSVSGPPERIFQMVSGPAVLRQEKPPAPPSVWLLFLLTATPPAVCLVWYGLWRKLSPDAARLARQRRSLAAQQAFESLSHGRANGAITEAVEAGEILAVYLRHKTDLPSCQPTPAEVVRHLKEKGVSTALSLQVADFFRACDAARFMPNTPTSVDNFRETAARLITCLESEP